MKPLRTIRRRACDVGAAWPEQVPPLLRQVYAARGAHDLSSAQPRLGQLPVPDGLHGIEPATGLLAAAIAADRHIVVVGDFDCDGASACAVAVRGLRLLGARRVSYAVPNRMVHGYGLSPALVADLAALQPELLVTVDHGIACHAGIAAAKAMGWQVLVTDHHLPGDALPPADAIVNPNQPGDGFAGKALAGVGVIFYVLLALRKRLREAGAFAAGAEPDLTVLLDLVAVGTVADLVPLDVHNRALVAAGLRRLRAGQGCAGLQALIEVSGRKAASLSAADIGYAVAPRINAAGRLEDMAVGIECLLCDDPRRARELAQTLDGINAERRAVQQQMVDEAEAALSMLALAETASAAHCLFDASWHPGVVGLVASKMKERLHRPVIAFAPSEPGSEWLRGSARSIPGFHIRDALAAVDAAHPSLIERFGGHAMAAGLSLRQAHLADFAAAFADCAARTLDAESLCDVIASDGELMPEAFVAANALALRDGGPWGQAFPEPVFDGEFAVLAWRPVGTQHLKLELGLGPLRLNAIEFGGWTGTPPGARVRIAYRLALDEYRGGEAIQLIVVHRESADGREATA
ncbi:single-stranded-DNA-specific exonuclease RecJ [Luteimonas aquatica]|uniref:single-stranded-DNA-specific exonuclease RecJ n=1 Tax=Luteimonas aquatica TaxID=450364 RepID=UPI001F5AB663|nr:single-stranded-DNA-specific exonuclease RecJ [Luteimonas aquatica]